MSSGCHRSFDHDLGRDWLEDLGDSDAFAFFVHCLDLTDQDELSFIACVGVLCTSELLYGVLIQPRAQLPEAAIEWIESNQAISLQLRSLLPSAVDGLNRVLLEDSAMSLRWEDAGVNEHAQWQKEVVDLKAELEKLLQQYPVIS